VIGLYLLAAGVSGLQLLGASSWVSDVFNGATLVLAVIFATTMRRGALAGRLRVGRQRLAEDAAAAPEQAASPPS
jgi:ribose/xylose/arabinose/galactoside ABC-type transport system permease subunit